MKILIADDHPLTLQGTVSFIEKMGHKVVSSCSNGKAALNYIQLHTPDLAILDLNMPGLDGIEVAQKIFESKSRTKIVLLTMHNEMSILKKAKEYNIYGYILKDKVFPDMENCLKEIENGKKYFSSSMHVDSRVETVNSDDLLSSLTLSERKIIELIAAQKTSKQIAEALFLSEKTVEGHRSKIIEKLGLPKEKNTLLKWAIQQKK